MSDAKILYDEIATIVTQGSSPTHAVELAEIEYLDKFHHMNIERVDLIIKSGGWQCIMRCTGGRET